VTRDNYVYIEEEVKVGECEEGTLIGEIAMLDPDKEKRAKSAMAKTDCVFLILNTEAF
jgi:CRP-like cAMP-binding protein